MQVFPPVVANVGVNGVRPTREGLGRTPVGVFTLTEAFGNQPNNGTRLPYGSSDPTTGGTRTRPRLTTTDWS